MGSNGLKKNKNPTGVNGNGGVLTKNPGGPVKKNKNPPTGNGGVLAKNPGNLGKNPATTASNSGKNPGPKIPGGNGKKPGGSSVASGRKPGSIAAVGSKYQPNLGGGWDQHQWFLAWNVYWYHCHPVLWNGGWVWWNPDDTQWVVWEQGVSIPEDQYFAPGPIRIRNPESTATALTYELNDSYPYDIQAGESQDLDSAQTWVIEFDRGGDLGTARYTLDSGEYYFGESDHGWELYHADAASDGTSDT